MTQWRHEPEERRRIAKWYNSLSGEGKDQVDQLLKQILYLRAEVVYLERRIESGQYDDGFGNICACSPPKLSISTDFHCDGICNNCLGIVEHEYINFAKNWGE